MTQCTAQTVGQIEVQHDWFDILRSFKAKVWVSCSSVDLKTVYGEIWSVSCNGEIELHCTEGFEVHFIGKRVLVVKSIDLDITSYFFPPVGVFPNVHDKAIKCLDVSPGGGLAVSCGDDQGLFVWQTENGIIRRSMDGHISDVSTCQFFPSGTVILSGGLDMRLRIWSVEDGSCPVTLVGHTGAITSTEIVDRGRNIISCSRDGSALLWDCGTAKCISKIKNCSSVINSSCMRMYESNVTDASVERSESENGTHGKLLALAREDGALDFVDLRTRKTIGCHSFDSSVNDCCFIGENNLVAGLQDGRMAYFDLRNISDPFKMAKYGKSSINCLQSFPGNSVLVGRGNGATTCIRTVDNNDIITMELNGPNCDPIYSISSHNNFVYTACRDRNIRRYRLDLNT